MLMQADFDLNSAQIYTESLKEVLKKTMLDQEVMFRKQVCGHHHYADWVMCWLFLFLFRWVMCWLQDHVSLFDTIMSSVSDNFLNLFLVKCSIWWRFLPNYMNHTLVLNITDFRDIWDFLFKIWLLVTCVAMGTCMYWFSRKKKPWLP